MATNRYSLADHQVVITMSNANGNTDMADIIGEGLTIGGYGEDQKGSFVGTITVTRNKEIWTTKGDETGSWVHELNLDKTGSVRIDINQVSDTIYKLVQIVNLYANEEGSVGVSFNINVTGAGDEVCATCNDCYISKIPDQNYAASTELQRWEFTCGKVTLFPNNK